VADFKHGFWDGQAVTLKGGHDMKTKRTKKPKPVPSTPVSSTQNLEDLRAAKEEWWLRWLKVRQASPPRGRRSCLSPDPTWNIQGIGIGEKMVDGRHTGTMAVKFLVRTKFHAGHIRKKHSLPKSIDGLPVDVEEVGLLRAFNGTPVPDPLTQLRPAQPGCSVGFAAPGNNFLMAGTFGALVKDANGIYILSNNHVLADENLLVAGAPIFQPGLEDGGNAQKSQIARLTDSYIRLHTDAPNQVDCAVALVPNPSDVKNAILQVGPPNGTGNAQHDMVVHKFGRATRYTVGIVNCIDANVTVHYPTTGNDYKFTGQITIAGLNGQPFGDDGDSGSLVLQRATNMAVGLLIGGSPECTIANHIGDVLTALGVALA
jgi:hypothetical protein